MTDDERARKVMEQLVAQDIVSYSSQTLYNGEKLLLAYARDERRRVWEEAAKISEAEVAPWNTAQERLMAQQIAKAIRHQAEEEGHG